MTSQDNIFDQFLEHGSETCSLSLRTYDLHESQSLRLAKNLASHSRLTSLDLSYNTIPDRAAFRFSRALSVNTRLTALRLGRCHLQDAGLSSLFSALQVNTTLRCLSLDSNVVSAQAAASLHQCLRVNRTLSELRLSHASLDTPQIVALSKALMENHALTILDLSGNHLSPVSVARIAHALTANAALLHLDLHDCHIDPNAALQLHPALQMNETLVTMDLRYNDLSFSCVAQLARALQGNATLTALEVGDALQQHPVLHDTLRVNQLLNPQHSSESRGVQLFEEIFHNKQVLSFPNRPVLTPSNIAHLPLHLFSRQFSVVDLRNQPELTLIPAVLGHLDPAVTRSIHFDVANLLPSMRPFAGDASATIQYAKAMLEGHLVRLRQVKLMVVGRPGVGKTTLVRRFYGKRYKGTLRATDGVDLGDFVYQGMRFSTWDFGGQKVYRYTHQLLLGDNTIYLLLFRLTDPLEDTLGELRFWLNSILSRTKNPTVVLAGTHLDVMKRFSLSASRIIAAVKTALQEEYPFLFHPQSDEIFPLCCVPYRVKTIAPLLNRLLDAAKCIQISAPNSFSVAEHYFSQLAASQPPVVTYRQAIAALAQRLPEQTAAQIAQTLESLADFGTIALFHQPRTASEGLIVHRPQWIAALFASVVNFHDTFVAAESGTVKHDTIVQHIWADAKCFPKEHHEDFLRVLTELHVIFPFTELGQKKFFIPCRLREEPLDVSQHLSPLVVSTHRFFFHRIFRLASPVPTAVIPPLLIELMRHGRLVARWQQGGLARIVEEDGHHSLWVHLWKSDACTVTLKMWGQRLQACAGWIRALSMLLDNRLREFYHIDYATLIPCADCEEYAGQHPEFKKGHFADASIHRVIREKRDLISCTGAHHHTVRVDYLAPDLLYEDLIDDGFIFDYDRFKVIKMLGAGSYGKVYMVSLTQVEDDVDVPSCVCSPSSSAGNLSSSNYLPVQSTRTVERFYALKILSSDDDALENTAAPSESKLFQEFKREVFMMRLLHHPFMLQLHGICKYPIAMVMEIARGGDLAAQLLDPLGFKSKISRFAKRVRAYFARHIEGPLHKHTAVYLIANSAHLDPASRATLKQSCRVFLQAHADLLIARGRYFIHDACPFQFILDLHTIDDKDPCLALLQAQYAMDAFGLTPQQIDASLCAPIVPLSSIDGPNGLADAEAAFEQWLAMAAREPRLSDAPLRHLRSAFFLALQRIHDSPGNCAVGQELKQTIDLLKLLEQQHRRLLVPIPFPLQLKLAAEIAFGLLHLHSLQPPIVHRDLRPSNVFLTDTLIDFPSHQHNNNNHMDLRWKVQLVKLADFGLSVRAVRSGQLSLKDRNDGDPLLNLDPSWAAPELLLGGQYTAAVDVYSFGITLWQLAAREAPFQRTSGLESRIIEGLRPEIPKTKKNQTLLWKTENAQNNDVNNNNNDDDDDDTQVEEYVALMQQCWHDDPAQRPCMALVYQRLLGIVGSHASTRFLKDILPNPSAIAAPLDPLPLQQYAVQSFDLPLAPFRANSREMLPNVTCMIAPFQTEEFWLGCDNGVVAHARYDEALQRLDVVACQQCDSHASRVNAIAHCLGQGGKAQGGSIWSASERGRLCVWSPFLEEPASSSEHNRFKYKFSVVSRSAGLMSGEKTAKKYWVEFEDGRLSFFSNQFRTLCRFMLDLRTDVREIELQKAARKIILLCNTARQRVVLSPHHGLTPKDAVALLSQCFRMLRCFLINASKSASHLKMLAHFDVKDPGTAESVGIQALCPLDRTVLCATHNFVISEFALVTSEDTGVHDSFFIVARRTFSLQCPRPGPILGFLRVNPRSLWIAMDCRFVVLDLDPPALPVVLPPSESFLQQSLVQQSPASSSTPSPLVLSGSNQSPQMLTSSTSNIHSDSPGSIHSPQNLTSSSPNIHSQFPFSSSSSPSPSSPSYSSSVSSSPVVLASPSYHTLAVTQNTIISASSANRMVSLLLVRGDYFDQVITGHAEGHLTTWHLIHHDQLQNNIDNNNNMNNNKNNQEHIPLLIPKEHAILPAAQLRPNKPSSSQVGSLIHYRPHHLWLGTSQGELISWNLLTQTRDREDTQPLRHRPDLQPKREIGALLAVQDAAESAVVWCLSKERRFLRFAGLRSLYRASQQHREQQEGNIAYGSSEFALDAAQLKWSQEEQIGEGGFGRVFKGRYYNSKVAVKVMPMQREKELTQEIGTWCTFHHPHVVQLYGYYAQKPRLLIVMELMDVSLFDVLYKSRVFSPPNYRDCMAISRAIASGLTYIHDRQAVHQDLKSSNVLLRGYGQGRSQFEVKLADFGATRPMEALVEAGETVISLYWSAPELFSTYATVASDVYAMGMVFYELFMRRVPFLSEIGSFEGLRDAVCRQKIRPVITPQRMALQPEVAQPLIGLIARCWRDEPYLRPTAAQVLRQLTELADNANHQPAKMEAIGSPFHWDEVESGSMRFGSPIR